MGLWEGIMKKIITRRTIVSSIGATALIGRRSIAQTSDDLYRKSREEGRVALYSTLTEHNIDPLVAAFSEKYPGIAVEYTRLNSGGIVQRFSAEKQANAKTADVIHHAAIAFHLDALKRGWLAPIGSETLGEFPKDYVHPELGPMIAQHLVLTSYNTRLVSAAQAPKTWSDLTDPRWRGKMLFLNPRDSEYMVMVLGGLIDSGLGDGWLEKIRDQKLRYPPGGSVPASELLAAGEAAIFPFNNGLVVRTVINAGAPVAYTIPTPQTGPVTLVGLNGAPANPNAARLLTRYILSREGSNALYSADAGVVATPYTKGAFKADFLPLELKYYDADQRKRIYDLLGLK